MTQSATNKEYRDYIASKHAEFHTNADLINEHVRQATGAEAISCDRLIVGEENEVYDVETSQGESVIVRISHKEDHRFEAEKWALDKCRQVGVPTPEVLLIAQARDGKNDITFCVEEKLPGVSMGRFLQDNATAPVKHSMVEQIKDAIARIHSIPVKGFGHLDAQGEGDNTTWRDLMLDTTKQTWLPKVLSDTVGISEEDTHKMFDLLIEHTSLYENRLPYLNHGDLGLDHFLTQDGKLTGIIDFQGCTGADPLLDYAWLDFFWGKDLPSDQIIGEAAQDPEYILQLELAKIRLVLWMGQYYGQNGNHKGVSVVKDNFQKSKVYFNL